ncbi:DUF1254 domain-containing protein [Phenylobacterium sp.]|uniref:DUF1254 domain-containing protein n=1 Tax=Phenylobacterium sp. TaxID=1871053 RepID=UPI0030F3E641
MREAEKAWLYALPLIEMAAARVRMLDTTHPGLHSGLNRFVHNRELVGPADREITTPNNDTLYSSAWIDLTDGPVTLTLPDPGARYVSIAVMDMYTNNSVILGARTPSGPAGVYRLVGPDEVELGENDLKVGTPHAWVLARILVAGDADLPDARAFQADLELSGPAAAPPKGHATRDDAWPEFFRSAADLLGADPPGSIVGLEAFERIRAAGRGGNFDPAGYSGDDLVSIEAGVARARTMVSGGTNNLRFVEGWSYPLPDLGQFGDSYRFRAAVAVQGLGALEVAEAMYMRAQSEEGSWAFNGDGLYCLSLAKPVPIDGFWSLTMYEATDDGQFFLTENRIGRYAIGDRTPGLVRNADGGVDIWIGREDPGGEKTANWLPAPRSGPFALFMRAYLPKPEMLDGTYRLPPIRPV